MELLKDVLRSVKYEVVNGVVDGIKIKTIQYDSRKVGPNDLFVCRVGANVDGHNFVRNVEAAGAKAIITEKDLHIDSDIVVIKVKDTDAALSIISNNYYGEPSKKLFVTGITGTNGKTSISYLVQEILNANNASVGVIGTIGMVLNSIPLDLETTMPTTPDSLELQNALSQMHEKGATDVVMEVSSIALDQSRVKDTDIKIGVFTNLTVDHLDYHQTMENYEKAKFELFRKTPTCIINVDDAAGKRYLTKLLNEYPEKKTLSYSTIYPQAEYYATNIKTSPGKTSFDLIIRGDKRIEITTNLTGLFNVSNVLAAIAVGIERGVTIEVIVEAFKHIKGATGRFETITSEEGVSVIIDYAHTPDALEKVLETINKMKNNGYNKVITVFGCGGDRDKSKRPEMARISEKLSDYTILTSDNPRTENPNDIIKDIEQGMKEREKYSIEPDRALAIEKAIKLAKPKDIVLVAGKGHETYQIIGSTKYHLDDMEEVKKHI